MTLINSEIVRDQSSIRQMEKVPLVDRGLASCTYEVLMRAAEAHGEREALVFFTDPDAPDFSERLTYREFADAINQSAHLFTDLGIDRTTVVSLALPNCPQFHYAFWGAQAVGIVNPLNYMLAPEALIDLLRAAGSKVLVTYSPKADAEFAMKLEAIAASDLDIQILVVGGEWGDLDDFDTVRTARSSEPIVDLPAPDDIAALFQTGGTTGRPKLAQHSHRNEVYMAWAVAQMLHLSASDTVLCGLPLFHVNGVFVTGLAPFSKGATVVIATRIGFRHKGLMAKFWSVVDAFKVSVFSCVPAILTGLLDLPLNGADVASLRYVICGAAPLPESMIRRFERQFPLKVLEGYGLTEGSCVSTINPADGEARVGSVGLALPYQRIEIRHDDPDGRSQTVDEPGTVGSVFISGPNIFPGYVDTMANKGVLGSDGWLNTGDLGYLDADGYLWLSGRAKDLIIRGGHNIDPSVIEDTLAEHPAVAQVAAVGLPDKRVGELPAAFVTLVEGQDATPHELIRFVASRLSERSAVPAEIYILSEMPLTAVGKIFKPELRRRLVERVLQVDVETAHSAAQVRAVLHDIYGLVIELDSDLAKDLSRAKAAVEAYPYRVDCSVSEAVIESAATTDSPLRG